MLAAHVNQSHMEPIVPGVHTLPLEFEWEGTTRLIHPAAIETESGLILLDTGFQHHVEALEAHLHDAGFGFDDVELLVITHQDRDHAGALATVADETGATTLAHVDDAPYIAGDKALLKGGEYPDHQVDIGVVDGVVFQTVAGEMQVVATPGHSPGHISLYLPDEKLLIAGDAITAEDAFDGPNEDATLDMETAIESIGRLATLEVERTLCFHGGYVEHDSDRLHAMHSKLAEQHG